MGRFGTVAAVCAAASTLLLALPCAALASASRHPAASGDPAASWAIPGSGRIVSYRGYQLRVPASWPVYRLAAGTSRCVLFNRHAVYLGNPGADQRCPARAFGKTEALLVQPLGSLSNLPPGTAVLRGAGSASLPTGAAAAQDAASHALSIALPAAGVQVTATYGTNEALVRGILASARLRDVSSAADSHPGGAGAGGGLRPATARRAARGAAAERDTAAAPAGHSPAAQSLVGERGSGLGFDTCTAPSAATMTDWLDAPFRVAGTYLGGDNWACTYGNFTKSWVSKVAAEGWQFIPIWLGPQAPCSTIPGAVLINPAKAAAQGQSQAASAVAAAAGFGYAASTPIYFDMEGYDSANTTCKQAVLDFLAGWTKGLHAAGYVSGVYSSAASGIADLASKYGQPGYASPDDIWIADWTGDPVLTDSYLPDKDWADHQRLHQYYSAHVETWGGASVDVDNDVINGAVAGLSSAPQPPAAHVLGHPDAVTVAPGAHATVRLVLGNAGSHSSTVGWQVQAPTGLTVSPDNGSAPVKAGHPVTVTLRVAASSSAPQGRYDLPVTATAGGQQLAETFELVSVAAASGSLPTAQPIVLYAADSASMATAAKIARRLALPTADLTGTFSSAWTDLTGGKDLLLVVGQAALNGLFTNPCGWSNPAGTGAGSTPFTYLGEPLRQPPGADYFENSAAASTAVTGQVTSGLTHYALAGTLPDEGTLPAGPSAPTSACLGSPVVSVP
jgi:hypothetical protein